MLIGLWSPAPQCGKSTVAELLAERHEFYTLPFAGTLKEMLRVLLRDLGLSERESERALFFEKEQPLEALAGLTPRRALQTLGTEWGRQCIDPQLWVRAWRQQLQSYRHDGAEHVVADDMRFPEELEAIRQAGGFTVVIQRPGVVNTHSHASEGGLAAGPFDWILLNDGDEQELLIKVDRMIKALSQVHAPRPAVSTKVLF